MKPKHGVVVLSLISSVALAAPPMSERFPHLQPHSENGVTYVCGGIGDPESTYMKQAARDHDAMLIFSSSNGAYLADVNVEISDARGRRITRGVCGGPVMLIDVQQAGTYRINAEFDGQTQSRAFHIGPKGHVRQVFVWPQRHGTA